jgi:hypothetical protein
MAEVLKNRFLYVKADLWNGFTTEQKAAYDNSIVFVKNGNDGVAIYTQGATFGTLDEAEVKAIIEKYGYATTGELNSAVQELTAAIATAKSEANAYTDGEVAKEKGRAEGVEAELNDAIQANATAIETEKGRAEGVEAELNAAIQANATAIETEANRAKEAEKTLTDNLAAEKERAEGAESALSTRIDNIVAGSKSYEVVKLTEAEVLALRDENVKEAYK